jgi:hypothetical protein
MRILRKNKFNAKKVKLQDSQGNIVNFDSVREAERAKVLMALQVMGNIKDLVFHPAFPITWPDKKKPICKVVLDFQYTITQSGVTVYEDVKGKDNPLSKLKRKLVEDAYNINVEIIK